MKKILISILAAACAATALTGCSPSAPDLSMPTADRARADIQQTQPAPPTRTAPPEGFSMHRSALPGKVRKAVRPTGTYTIEYIHFSQSDKPDTMPEYTLELNDDNTFTFHADVNGVVSDHYGNWYIKRGGSLILFYDEPTETPAHNTFIADCMYMEMLPHGKIMFYDERGTIVLSKTHADAPQAPDLSDNDAPHDQITDNDAPQDSNSWSPIE